MISNLPAFRAAAEPFKSFPKAVAAVVKAMFDKGATQVSITYHQTDGMKLSPPDRLYISCDVCWNNPGDPLQAATDVDPANLSAWALHHSRWYRTLNNSFGFMYLGRGEGVSRRQDRSAKRLVRELPKLLSPNEAFNTTVVEEDGTEHRLAKDLSSAVVDGLHVSWSEKMVGFGCEGLTLKVGAARSGLFGFLGRTSLSQSELRPFNILVHPWLGGAIEVQTNQVFKPKPNALGDFPSTFFQSDAASQLVMAIREIIPEVALRAMNKVVDAAMAGFAVEGKFTVSPVRFHISCANLAEIPSGEGRVIWIDPNREITPVIKLLLNVTHPVFHTIGPDRDEIMQIIWWQLAMWIEGNVPDIHIPTWASDPQFRTTAIYRLLREQNPER